MKKLEQIVYTDEEQTNEIKKLKSEFASQTKYLKELEERSITLNNEYI